MEPPFTVKKISPRAGSNSGPLDQQASDLVLEVNFRSQQSLVFI